MISIREAQETDVEAVRNLFIEAYGLDYPFKDFYETHWLKKNIYSDDTLFLVAEVDGKIVATASAVLNGGREGDLITEIGRLVVGSESRNKKLTANLMDALIEGTKSRTHFLFAEPRTIHFGPQRIAKRFAMPVGFQPLKYRIQKRETMMLYANVSPQALELRRNNPRVIAEVSLLAQTALYNLSLSSDIIVDGEEDGYPTSQKLDLKRLKQVNYPTLLRIKHGRLLKKELFSSLSLAQGLFKINNAEVSYLVAQKKNVTLGAVGFIYDKIDNKIRISELIETDEALKGALLAAVDKVARQEYKVDFIEVDVSAYSPKIQRTFIRLGFIPVAYCPAMVFQHTERLDIIRMMKICIPYNLGEIHLLPSSEELKDIVELGLRKRVQDVNVKAVLYNIALFQNILEGDLEQLASIALIKNYVANTHLIVEGTQADTLFILIKGTAQIHYKGKIIGTIPLGNLIGEMGIVKEQQRTADIILSTDSTLMEIELKQLKQLMQANPRLGLLIMTNIAKALSEKLHLASDSLLDLAN